MEVKPALAKVEIGRTYRRRDGSKVTLAPHGDPGSGYLYRSMRGCQYYGFRMEGVPQGAYTWHCHAGPHELDLVEDITPDHGPIRF